MINSKETTPRPDAAASGDNGLEEVRLRQQAIGVKLRHMFDQVVNEPVPDEFLDILRRADDRSSTKDGQ
ncbi:NepR family anti-sigma factor [Brevundimonas sp. NPDC058933]|uniref:anti-sigma T factor NepR n=1 Tax=Brevundimonas sp. NPDC058933 TaxID=3346673 RepID=UPI003BEF3C00